jgi:putative transposase
MTAICETLGVARSNVAERVIGRPDQPMGRPPLPDGELVTEIKKILGDMPSYGYKRVWAILRRRSEEDGRQPVNHKRVYRVMKAHGLLLQRHAGGADQRRHDGKIAVAQSNLRWCSDGFEVGCDNAEKVRVAFALDCCDREAMAFVATTEGIKAKDVRDLMITAVEHRFGRIDQLPQPIEWLTDNGSSYIAHETRRFARQIGLEPVTTPVESPQSNGMAEAFVRTIKRDYARVASLPNAETVIRLLPSWFEHYNEVHPHRALKYRSPRQFIEKRSTAKVQEGKLSGT